MILRSWRDVPLAVFDTQRVYRYALKRDNGGDHKVILWVMLNPSTADEEKLDPTLRRCYDFTQRFGYGGMLIGNVFAYRATDPRRLKNVSDPFGPVNEWWLTKMASLVDMTIVGWGTNVAKVPGLHLQTAVRALRAGDASKYSFGQNSALYCLGTNADGSPKHPLYLKGTAEPRVWVPGGV